jgi:hypothetical protein
MFGVMHPIRLEERNIMLVSLMIIASLPGSICSNLNLKFLKKIHEFQKLVERLFDRKILKNADRLGW